MTSPRERPLLIWAALALGLSLLLRGALHISTNPVEGMASYGLVAGAAGFLQLLSVGLFSAWAALRTLARPAR